MLFEIPPFRLPKTVPTPEHQPSPFERFLERELKGKYEEQARLLDHLKLLQILLKSQEYGIVDEEQREYPFPEYEDIKAEILNHKDVFEKKFEQGLTELRITPFALPIQRLFDAIERELRRQHDQGTLRSTDKTPLDLDTDKPFDIWDGYKNQEPVYFSENFNQTNHGGKTKKELLDSRKSTFPGFLVSLVEPDQTIPREGQGATIGGRTKPEANKRPNDYLELLKRPEYAHESGITIEEWAIRFLSALKHDGTVLDDWDAKDADGNENASACYNLGTFFPADGRVSRAYWYRDRRRARAGRDGPASADRYRGSCFSVRVGTP